MDAKERYFWDVTGYLVVKNVLSTEELEVANEAIDYCADRINQDEDNKSVGDSTFCVELVPARCMVLTC